MADLHLVATHGPLFGHFFATFALPKDTPPLLRGPCGEMVARIGEIGSAGALYLMDAFAHNLVPFKRNSVTPSVAPDEAVYDIPIAVRPDLPILEKWIHSSVIESITNLLPTLKYKGVGLMPGTFQPIGTSKVHDDFALVYESPTHVVNCVARVVARSPVISWWFNAQRRDGQDDTEAITIDFNGIEVVHTDGALMCKFGSIATAYGALLVKSPSEAANPILEDYSNSARDNARKGPWFGLVHEWQGSWMGWSSIVEGNDPIHSLSVDAITRGSGGWGGRLRPNDAGVDSVFGSIFSAPIWFKDHLPDPRIVKVLLNDGLVWSKRPIHWLEPNSTKSLRWDPVRAKTLTIHEQQPYSGSEAALIGVGPKYRGLNGVLWSYDHQHRAVGPLVAATILTGDPRLTRSCDSILGGELYERSIMAGWLQDGRGHGRPVVALSLLARVSNDNSLVDGANVASKRRLDLLKSKVKGSPTTPVWANKLETTGSNWGTDPFWVPYEQAWTVAGHWLEWLRTGDTDHLVIAYRLGRGVVTGFVTTNPVDADVAYWVKWFNGQPASTPGTVNPATMVIASEAFQRWAMSAAKIYLLARPEIVRLGLQIPEDVIMDSIWGEIAKRGIIGLEAGFDLLPLGEQVCAAHTGLLGAFPELTRPILPTGERTGTKVDVDPAEPVKTE